MVSRTCKERIVWRTKLSPITFMMAGKRLVSFPCHCISEVGLCRAETQTQNSTAPHHKIHRGGVTPLLRRLLRLEFAGRKRFRTMGCWDTGRGIHSSQGTNGAAEAKEDISAGWSATRRLTSLPPCGPCRSLLPPSIPSNARSETFSHLRSRYDRYTRAMGLALPRNCQNNAPCFLSAAWAGCALWMCLNSLSKRL